MKLCTSVLLLAFCCQAVCQTKQTEAQKPVDVDYLQEAARTSIFIYEGSVKPCDPVQLGRKLEPIGSAFLMGIANSEANGSLFSGWQFVVTAEHVVHDRNDIVLRLNRADDKSKVCFPIHLERTGPNQNTFSAKEETDLVAINVPTFPDTAPIVMPYSWVLDKDGLQKYDLKVGTGVFTVGYLLGYPGEARNYPVTKFGRISVLTDERWFLSDRGFYENAYVVELQNVLGLSGAPLFAYGQEIKLNPLRFRILPPLIVGVVKDVLLVHDQKANLTYSQGLAAVEPGYKLKELLDQITNTLKSQGQKPILDFNQPPAP